MRPDGGGSVGDREPGPQVALAGAARREHGQRRRRAGPAGRRPGGWSSTSATPTSRCPTPAGRRPRRWASWLAALPEDERPTAALSSPFTRALDHGASSPPSTLGIRVRTDERLRERDFGAFDGMTGAGIREQFPEEAQRRDLLGKFYYRPPGGESWADVALRVRSVLATEGLRYDGERLLIVAHQAVIMVFRYVLEELTEQELLEVDKQEQVANASVTRYEPRRRRQPAADVVQRRRPPDRRGRRRHRGARCARPATEPHARHPRAAARLAAAGADRRQERARLDPGDRRQRRDPGRGAAGRRGGACGPAPASCRWPRPRRSRRSPPPRCPRRWSAALPETDGGAIRAEAADAVRDLAESADAVLLGPGMTDKDETQGFGERLLPHLTRPGRAGRAGAGLRDGRRRLPAAPRRAGRAHAQPDRARHRAARRRGRDRRRPGRAAQRLADRARRRSSGLGGVDVVDRRPGRPVVAGRERRRRAWASPARATCARASPAACSRAEPTRRRRPSGRRSCTGARGERLSSSVGRARVPGPRAAGRDPARARRDHRLTARLPDGRRRRGRQLHR